MQDEKKLKQLIWPIKIKVLNFNCNIKKEDSIDLLHQHKTLICHQIHNTKVKHAHLNRFELQDTLIMFYNYVFKF